MNAHVHTFRRAQMPFVRDEWSKDSGTADRLRMPFMLDIIRKVRDNIHAAERRDRVQLGANNDAIEYPTKTGRKSFEMRRKQSLV